MPPFRAFRLFGIKHNAVPDLHINETRSRDVLSPNLVVQSAPFRIREDNHDVLVHCLQKSSYARDGSTSS